MLRLEHVQVSFRKEVQKKLFGTERKTVLHDISFEVKKGECLGILGESGSGKSTIGRVLCGLLRPDRGSVTVDGAEIYGSYSLPMTSHPSPIFVTGFSFFRKEESRQPQKWMNLHPSKMIMRRSCCPLFWSLTLR